MIFTAQQANMILAGQKTRHTIPGSESRPPYQVGRPYSARKRRAPTWDDDRMEVKVATIVVTSLEFIDVSQMDDKAARREGFASAHLFRKEWVEQHGESTGAWTFSFTVDRRVPERYLSRPVALKHGEYTRSPRRAIDDLAAVDEFTQERISAQAQKQREQSQQARSAERELLDLDARLRLIQREAAAKDIDLSRQEQAIRERIKAMERKVRSRAA